VREDDGNRRPAFNLMDPKCWKLAAPAFLVLAGLVVVFVWDPADSVLFPPCPFHALTGFHCPGCGTLRALHQLLHGNLVAAFLLNPLAVLCLPFVAYALVSGIIRSVGGRGMPTVCLPAPAVWTLLGAIVVFWVLRNVPVYPFSLLAP